MNTTEPRKIVLLKVEKSSQAKAISEQLQSSRRKSTGLVRLFAAFGKHNSMSRKDPTEI